MGAGEGLDHRAVQHAVGHRQCRRARRMVVREPDLRRTRHADRLGHHGGGVDRSLRQRPIERPDHRQRLAGTVGDARVEALDGGFVEVAGGGREIGGRADARIAELAFTVAVTVVFAWYSPGAA